MPRQSDGCVRATFLSNGGEKLEEDIHWILQERIEGLHMSHKLVIYFHSITRRV